VVAVAKDPAKVLDLDANTLAALGGRSPEKWEGLTVGPRLSDGRYALIAGTDNDYSVTQNAGGVQFDVYFDFAAADPYRRVDPCPIGQTTGCVFTAGGAPATLTAAYRLLPGVLHAYAARIDGYVAPAASLVPEPQTLALTAAGPRAPGDGAPPRRAPRRLTVTGVATVTALPPPAAAGRGHARGDAYTTRLSTRSAVTRPPRARRRSGWGAPEGVAAEVASGSAGPPFTRSTSGVESPAAHHEGCAAARAPRRAYSPRSRRRARGTPRLRRAVAEQPAHDPAATASGAPAPRC
jgi:hypothetical protein